MVACADAMQRLCTAAEVKFYGQNLLGEDEGEVKSKYRLRPNRNCNMSAWPNGCEPGWSCNVKKEDKVDIKNDKVIPDRVLDCQPCCPGFFCPLGLTCMIRESISLPLNLSILQNCDFCNSFFKPAPWDPTALELNLMKLPVSVLRKSLLNSLNFVPHRLGEDPI